MVLAMGSCQVCPRGRPRSRRGGIARRVGRGMWLLACTGAMILLLSPVAYALRHESSIGLRAKGEAQPTEEVEAAECPASPDAAKTFTATLSELKPKVQLDCKGDTNEAVPALATGVVCPPGGTLAACTADSGGETTKPVSLAGMLGGGTGTVSWVKVEGVTGGTKYELNFPDRPLPLLDASFLTGCKPKSGSHECQLTVKVQARKSAATGQTVYCAYGAESNTAKPVVTMTAQNNKMTLVCGNQNAAVLPKDYKTDYCTDEKAATACKTEKYTSFLKDFQPAWWTADETAHSVTLTIPEEQFPDTAKTIRLGCEYTPKAGDQVKNSNTAPTVCTVDVVISAKESSASARTGAILPTVTLAAIVLAVSWVM
ncbi:srs domain-containing protein [Cystoisospora suis]|uniref:Srs domain-containing protein n=1 Tax=Cystoisospora suis TaxID=483139 RepID=A0A2C6KG41_9APIC|nr:srs domain-containing protein [Cystoisospora suis]